MAKEKVIIIGSSGHAKVIIDIFEKQAKYDIIGLIDNSREIGESTLEYKIIGNESVLPSLISKNPGSKIFIAIGDNWIRGKVKQNLSEILHGLEFATAIHPSAQVAKDVEIGQGTAIMAGAIINSSSQIGECCIVNTKASIDHDNILGNFASLAPNATTGGNVNIGEFSAVGISATIKHGITIGAHSIIGASSLVLKNCGDCIVQFGVPASKIRTRQIGEKYL
jgi:sugar O-acyltransferase (sialic acid O-acetyltransferase NeuD family)